MKIYFSTSLRAKKLYQKNFEKIYKIIEDLGNKHTSDFILEAEPESFYKRSGKAFTRFYDKLTKQIRKADICVFEVSLHSLGIGYCVNLALDMGKPVVILHVKDKKPVLFQGIKDKRMQIYEYNLNNLERVLKDALEIAKDAMDIRFTFFITSKINRFLDWISKTKKIPRAVFLRRLINEAMEKEGFTE